MASSNLLTGPPDFSARYAASLYRDEFIRSLLQFGSRDVRRLLKLKPDVCLRHAVRAISRQIDKQSETMPRLSRRSFVAASAALLARPAPAAPAASAAEYDVVIVGAGAAGIAAARRIAAAGRRYVLIEAGDRIGGRCITDTRTFGVPFDRGAHWIHFPSSNPITKLVPRGGLEIYPAPQSQKVRIGLRNAREGELEDFLSAQVRATRAIAEAARKGDTPCAQALPNDLGDWRPTVEFVLGPFFCGKDLAQVSTADFARAPERRADAFCRQGFGALLASLGSGLAVQLGTRANAIDLGRGIAVETPKGTIAARTAIVTVSTNVIGSGRIRFAPELRRFADACQNLSLGSYDHVALELAGNPLGLESDDLVFEKSSNKQTGAILANVSGTSLCLVEVAGSSGRELAAKGEAAMVDFAADWLAKLYGAEVKKAVSRASATQWNADPRFLGAMSAAAPGAQAARRVLMEPIHDAVWYAGEAAHDRLWGTVGGAWESGERAAAAALRRLSGVREPVPEEKHPPRKRERSHRHGR
jgi:monoamine oxidase